MGTNKIHIFGFKSEYDSVSGTLNTPEYAAKISDHFDRLAKFFAKPNLEFVPKKDFDPFPDPNSMQLNAELWMDDGRQHQLYCLINRTITETTGVVSGM